MKWKWKKNGDDGCYHAKKGIFELQVWEVWDVGHSDVPVWLTAVDIKVSKDCLASLYPKNHTNLEKAKKITEKAAEDWIKKLNKSLK